MRVLVVSHTYISSINRKKWQIIASMYPDVELTVVFPSAWKTVMFDHNAENLETYNLCNCRFIAINARNVGNEVLYNYHSIKFFRLIKEVKPEIIQVEQGDNALSYFQTILFSKILVLNSKYIFFTWINWTHKFSVKYRLLWKPIENFNLKNSSAAIVGNEKAKDILLTKNFSKPVLVLPQLGVDTQIFFPKEKSWVNKIRIGFAGRLVEEKGIFLLLQVFKNLINEYPNLYLIILGSGPCKEKLAQQINKFNLKSNVEIIPPIPHEQVAMFMQKLDIFVLPSIDLPWWREQFGHVLIEAMACSVAVVGSDAGEIPNVLDGAGEIFKQDNADSLKKVLKKLITDDVYRKELAEFGYKKAVRDYSCEAIAEKTYNFWTLFTKKEKVRD